MEKCNFSINQIWNFNSTSVFDSNSFLPAVFVGEFLSVFKLLLLPAIIMHIAGVCIFAARTIIFFSLNAFFCIEKFAETFFLHFFTINYCVLDENIHRIPWDHQNCKKNLHSKPLHVWYCTQTNPSLVFFAFEKPQICVWSLFWNSIPIRNNILENCRWSNWVIQIRQIQSNRMHNLIENQLKKQNITMLTKYSTKVVIMMIKWMDLLLVSYVRMYGYFSEGKKKHRYCRKHMENVTNCLCHPF